LRGVSAQADAAPFHDITAPRIIPVRQSPPLESVASRRSMR